MGFGMVLGHNSQHPKTISSLLKSQELYSRPTLDTPHFPKASWYVSSLYHILSYYIPLIPIVHVAKDESPHQSPSVPIQKIRPLQPKLMDPILPDRTTSDNPNSCSHGKPHFLTIWKNTHEPLLGFGRSIYESSWVIC